MAQVAFGGGLAPTIAIIRTTGYGALQPVADDAANGRRCPLSDLPNAMGDRLRWVDSGPSRSVSPLKPTAESRPSHIGGKNGDEAAGLTHVTSSAASRRPDSLEG